MRVRITWRRCVVALVAIAALGGAVEWVVRRTSMEARRVEVERALSSAFGREVRFAGDFHLEIFPRPRLEATRVRVGSLPGESPAEWLAIETLRLGVALRPLLARRVELVGLAIEGAALRLEPGAVLPLGLAEGGSAPAGRLAVRLRQLELRDVRVAWSAAPTDGTAELRLDAVEIAAGSDDEPIGWSARGALRGADFDLSGSAGSLAELLQPTRVWPLAFEGRVGEADLRVAGGIAEPMRGTGLDLEGEVALERLRSLEGLAGRALPDGSMRGKLHLRDREGSLGIEGNIGLRTDDAKVALDLEGGLGDVVAREGLDAKLRIAAPDLRALGRAASVEAALPAIGPVSGTARLRGGTGAWRAEEVRLEAGRRDAAWLAIEGSLGNLAALAGVALDASLGARSPGELAGALGIAGSFPDFGPLSGRARLRDPRGRLAIERFELRSGAPGTLRLELTGALADLRHLDALEGQLHLDARDLGLLGAAFGAELPAIGPVGFEGHVRGSNERLDSEGSARVGATRFEGRASLELAGRARPRIEARLRSAHAWLEDLGLGSAREAGGAETPSERHWWRRRESLPWERLRLFDARLAVRVDRLTSAGTFDARDAEATLELDDGQLRVRDLVLGYEGGRVAGSFEADARTPEPEIALRVDATALDLAGVAHALGQSGAVGSGQLDLAADLRSRGASPTSLRERLGGRAALALRDWSAAGDWSRRFLLELSRAFLGRSQQGAERVGCLAGALGFDQGVGTVETLVLTGPKATIIGAGRVDLAREQWHLELVPRVHDPGLVGVAPAVRVTGPLDAPRFQPVPLDLVSGTLRSIVRTALSPAKLATDGARRLLGPAGRILSPVQGAIGRAGGEREQTPAAECAVPPPPGAAAPG